MYRLQIAVLTLLVATATLAQNPPAASGVTPEAGASPHAGQREHRPGIAGTITAMDDHSLTIKTMNGGTVTVNLTEKTQFRQDRQPSKLSEFKVGDMVFVGGQSTGDNSWQADFVATRSGMGGDAHGGMNPHMMAGEIKSIDGMQITIARPDGSTQTLTVDENTSFRKDDQSITLADLHPGDHVFARGAMKDGVFVPTMLNVGGPRAMWRRPPAGDSGNPPR